MKCQAKGCRSDCAHPFVLYCSDHLIQIAIQGLLGKLGIDPENLPRPAWVPPPQPQAPPLPDYYKALGLRANATPTAVKRKYRKLALKNHPDRGGDPARMAEINAAYAVLGDVTKRAEYDKLRACQKSRTPR